MRATIVSLPGDGIGPEVTKAACEILKAIAKKFEHTFEISEFPIGGFAMDTYGDSLPSSTLEACRAADAVLLGAVGGPRWDDPLAKDRPERGLLGLRKKLDLFANIRPVVPHPLLLDASPLKKEGLIGVDFIVVRELTSGIYFGEPRLRKIEHGEDAAIDTMTYTSSEIRRVAHLAFQLASQRNRKVTSVDKANVLECSRLWRQIVTEVSSKYPDITIEHCLVDAAAMYLITRPSTFDVILTENMFGDILTDEASVLTGSMGNMPSASLGETKNKLGFRCGVYEPIHGSAPDIAGKGIANPIGTILSSAMLLRHSLGLETESQIVERAVNNVFHSGYRTVDLAAPNTPTCSTEEITALITENINMST